MAAQCIVIVFRALPPFLFLPRFMFGRFSHTSCVRQRCSQPIGASALGVIEFVYTLAKYFCTDTTNTSQKNTFLQLRYTLRTTFLTNNVLTIKYFKKTIISVNDWTLVRLCRGT